MSSSLEHTVTSLLAARADAAPERLEELYLRAGPALLGWIALNVPGGLRGRVDPEEIAQETWLRALRCLDTFDPEQGTFRAWLLGIARNVLLETLRSLRSQPVGSGSTTRARVLAQCPDPVTSATRQVARDDALQRFIARVAELGEEEQVLVLSRGLEGLSAAEAALRLGITPAAAEKRWQRLRADLTSRDLPRDLLAESRD